MKRRLDGDDGHPADRVEPGGQRGRGHPRPRYDPMGGDGRRRSRRGSTWRSPAGCGHQCRVLPGCAPGSSSNRRCRATRQRIRLVCGWRRARRTALQRAAPRSALRSRLGRGTRRRAPQCRRATDRRRPLRRSRVGRTSANSARATGCRPDHGDVRRRALRLKEDLQGSPRQAGVVHRSACRPGRVRARG